MGRHPNKPWQRGYIPKLGPKVQDPAFTAPPTPEGWERKDRRDYNHYSTGTPFTYGWDIVGRAGQKWKVFRETPPVSIGQAWRGGGEKELRFESSSFDACLTFVKIEQSLEPEPQTDWGFADFSRRQQAKSRLHAELYSAGAQTLGKALHDAAAGQELTIMVHDEITTVVSDRLLKAYREMFDYQKTPR